MSVVDLLEDLQRKALRDPALRRELLDTKEEADPFDAFCKKCQEKGYEIYPMDLLVAGEEFYATLRRSTNGGGENSPKLKGEDDFYEMFMITMEQAEEAKE